MERKLFEQQDVPQNDSLERKKSGNFMTEFVRGKIAAAALAVLNLVGTVSCAPPHKFQEPVPISDKKNKEDPEQQGLKEVQEKFGWPGLDITSEGRVVFYMAYTSKNRPAEIAVNGATFTNDGQKVGDVSKTISGNETSTFLTDPAEGAQKPAQFCGKVEFRDQDGNVLATGNVGVGVKGDRLVPGNCK